MKVYIGTDHRGFHLKEKIAKWLFEWKYEFLDLGALKFDLTDDYTKYALEVGTPIISINVDPLYKAIESFPLNVVIFPDVST